MQSRALGAATQSSNALAGFRVGYLFPHTRHLSLESSPTRYHLQSSNSSSRALASLKHEHQLPRSPQLELELAQLNRAPARRVRYLPELDMEIEIVEPPKKAIVNEDLRVRALREHWDEKERLIHRHSSRPKPMRCVRLVFDGTRLLEVVMLTDRIL